MLIFYLDRSHVNVFKRITFYLEFRGIKKIDLIRSQRFYRVGYGGFYSLETYGKQGNQKSNEACGEEYPPMNTYPVSETLEPFVHSPPGDGGSNYQRNEYQFEKVF